MLQLKRNVADAVALSSRVSGELAALTAVTGSAPASLARGSFPGYTAHLDRFATGEDGGPVTATSVAQWLRESRELRDEVSGMLTQQNALIAAMDGERAARRQALREVSERVSAIASGGSHASKAVELAGSAEKRVKLLEDRICASGGEAGSAVAAAAAAQQRCTNLEWRVDQLQDFSTGALRAIEERVGRMQDTVQPAKELAALAEAKVSALAGEVARLHRAIARTRSGNAGEHRAY